MDDNRLAVVGYGEGAAVALLAARREDRIRAVALLAAPAVGGQALTLEQQEDLLTRLNVPPAERAEKIALQKRVLSATMSGAGWEGIPFELRRQADSATFRSWLLFDPPAVIARLEQPIFIAHGSLDDQIAPAHADRLETLSRSRRNAPPTHTRKMLFPGVTHRFARADVDDLAPVIAPEPVDALAAWLGDVIRSR